MSEAADANGRRRSRRQLAPFWVPLLLGLLSFFSMVSKPRFATFHPVDVVQLLGTGMCFGVALATLSAFFRRSGGGERRPEG
jgi:hypothetical protein